MAYIHFLLNTTDRRGYCQGFCRYDSSKLRSLRLSLISILEDV